MSRKKAGALAVAYCLVIAPMWIAGWYARKSSVLLDGMGVRVVELRELMAQATGSKHFRCVDQQGSVKDLGDPIPCGGDQLGMCVTIPQAGSKPAEHVSVYEAQLRCQAGRL